jgi:hypothetical protein
MIASERMETINEASAIVSGQSSYPGLGIMRDVGEFMQEIMDSKGTYSADVALGMTCSGNRCLGEDLATRCGCRRLEFAILAAEKAREGY